ncbi:MAG: hypothetical protein EOO12_00220 [Chitinophagaceae bacterium]|nr:MAG: hypothetical protein EOO12_00220 [Chitinophagaceae bacterium]
MQFPFGPFAPDAGELEPGICMVADGVLPQATGYGPAPGLNVSSAATALPADPRGMISVVLNDGTWQVYGFTAAEVYELQSDYTWTALSASLSVTAGDDVSAIHFGDYLLFTDTTDGLKSYNVETPAGFTSVTAAKAPRFIFTCANMVFGLDCLDDAGNRDNRLIRNSDFNSFTNWSTGAADYQPLEDGGALVAGFDLKDGAALILQERAVRLLQFGNAGGGALYSLRKVADGLGSVGAKSCVGYDGAVYWLATDGFRKFTFGGGIQTIGAGKVDEWFFNEVDQSSLSGVQGEVDPYTKMIWWRYKAQGAASDTVYDQMIGYSWQWDRWVTNSVSSTYLANIATPGVTLDSMDSYGVMDDIDIPLDSRAFQGGQPLFGALDSTGKFGTFSGGNQAAILTTSTAISPTSALIAWATPVGDASAGLLELGVKDEPADSITWKTGVAKVASGRVPLRGRGKLIAFRRTIDASATWTYARGVDFVTAAGGGPR